jgi:hypothetical protein
MTLLLKKSENCITKIVLSGSYWPLIILNSLAACSKYHCPVPDSPKAQCILVTTWLKFGDDFYVRFPAKRIVLNHGSLPEQERHSQNDKRTFN